MPCGWRPVSIVARDGMLLATSDWVRPQRGEPVEEAEVRFRTVGDATCTGAVRSSAATVAEVIAEEGHGTLVILNFDDDYGNGLAEDLKASFEAGGGEVRRGGGERCPGRPRPARTRGRCGAPAAPTPPRPPPARGAPPRRSPPRRAAHAAGAPPTHVVVRVHLRQPGHALGAGREKHVGYRGRIRRGAGANANGRGSFSHW